MLTPCLIISHDAVIVAHLLHVIVVLSRRRKLPVPMCGIGCTRRNAMPAPTSVREMRSFMLLPFGQGRCQHPPVASFSCPALLRLLLLVIHVLLIHHILARSSDCHFLFLFDLNRIRSQRSLTDEAGPACPSASQDPSTPFFFFFFDGRG